MSIIQDLFPGVEIPNVDYGMLHTHPWLLASWLGSSRTRCSAISGDGCRELSAVMAEQLPLGPQLYPPDMGGCCVTMALELEARARAAPAAEAASRRAWKTRSKASRVPSSWRMVAGRPSSERTAASLRTAWITSARLSRLLPFLSIRWDAALRSATRPARWQHTDANASCSVPGSLPGGSSPPDAALLAGVPRRRPGARLTPVAMRLLEQQAHVWRENLALARQNRANLLHCSCDRSTLSPSAQHGDGGGAIISLAVQTRCHSSAASLHNRGM